MKTESYFIMHVSCFFAPIIHVCTYGLPHYLFHVCGMCNCFGVFKDSSTLFPPGHIRGCTNMTRCEYLCLPNPNVPSKQTCTCTTGIEPLPDGACPESMLLYIRTCNNAYLPSSSSVGRALSRTQSALSCSVGE